MSDRNENPLEWVTTWVTTTTNQDLSTGLEDGRVQVQADGENVPGKVEQLGLPGHYAVATTGVDGLLLRLERGGWMVSAWTQPPSDAVTRECGIKSNNVIARVKPTDIFEVKASRTGFAVPATGVLTGGGISLGACDSSDGPILQVIRATDTVVTPLGVSVGVCMGTTVRVGAA